MSTGPGHERAVADRHLTSLAMAARTGAPEEVEAFTRAVYADVHRFLAHLTDAQSADDLTQETFVRVLSSLPRFASRSSARTWVLSIARRVVIDRFRAASARPVVADLADWQAAAERHQPRDLPSWQDGVHLAELLTGVPPERRAAFVLTQMVGLSYAEAADSLGCPVGTVRSRVARARRQLSASLLEAERPA
ncbi:RNA polymerase sigma-70 factor (ECF subfamily) [Thermocatellispora tengchongensis]|uniref:RNA polymerase sigma-70 factor (ECF subfamily) n=1 Tax=Thermocatellispora tengchongensis TaxID=1073253 RepID=A0A840PCP2_9ACTN|nr:sigma-70 family RNA polymerase sigma factor [Thermocatellispora tengchongensis]MBB5137388.1 RNA polymerase sigma-70 factor (ECF subfamily) [Thermocatellispora tengchongensis]